MISVKLFVDSGRLTGFEVSGHSGTAPKGQDIICAAVSSAADMTANTISEIYKASADITARDGYLKLSVKSDDELQKLLRGFELHMRALAKEFPKNIKVIYGGSKND